MQTAESLHKMSCRICRDTACPKKVTFELDSDWSSLFELCFGFQITQNGPLSFCESCSSKLRDYGEFKHLCLQSEEIWKSLMNYSPDLRVDKLNIVKEENIEECSGYPDTFEHDGSDYNVLFGANEDNNENLVSNLEEKLTGVNEDKNENLVRNIEDKLTGVKEDNNENLARNLEEKLTKISKPKIEQPLVKDKEHTDIKKPRKTRSKSSKSIKRCKYGKKRNKILKSLKSSKNNSYVSVKKEATDLFCGLCDFSSFSSVEVNQHLVRHCEENILNCQLCSFKGKDMAHMISHRYTHCTKKGKKVECPMCSSVFYNDKRLQFHYRSVHLGTKGGLCLICGRTFMCFKNWETHEKGHVSKNFICDHCGISFVLRYQIIEHMAIHYDIFKFICDLCGRRFKKSSNLKSHYFNHHIDHKKVTCTVCNNKFKHERYLKKHMLQRHSQKKYLCEVCSKGFCTNIMLREHMYYYHSDEKPYACDMCGARYRANLGLKIHKRIHTGELPYTCRECGKGFRSSGSCKRHLSVHTGVRPVKCVHCDTTFYSVKLMQAHCNSKHKDALIKGEVKL